MPAKAPSSRFASIYDSLPADAQRVFVEEHLVPLLDLVPKEKAKKVISAVGRVKDGHAGMPVLDFKAKKTEISGLLDELTRDAKRAFAKEHSNREELLTETVDSLTDWLNDIWTVVYEHKVNFQLAHNCLLYSADVLDHIAAARGGCKCAFMNTFVTVVIKDRTGKVIKSFSLSGAHSLDVILLWIWRELFVSLLDTKNRRQKQMIPEMLGDIQKAMGWKALENLLYGGRKCEYDDDEDLYGDEECYDVEDDEDEDRCSCRLHSPHWSARINSRRLELRELVQERFMSTFEESPSLALYNCIMSVGGDDDDDTEIALLDLLEANATSCSDSFAAALDIYAEEANTDAIYSLLITHKHLLRARDAPSFQRAVCMMSEDSEFLHSGLQILETELLDTARTIRMALLTSFSHIEDAGNKVEMTQIIKLRHGSSARTTRIERWVTAVITPGTAPTHPMVFAAFMMGLPMPPGMDDMEDGDAMGYLDIDQNDPDLADLREEFRPNLKDRWEGWTDAAQGMRGGPTVLLKVYKQIVDELMPYLRAADAVDEMISRLADRPSKHHVCDALESLSAFCKLQRKRITVLADKKKHSGPSRASSSTPPTPPANIIQGFSYSFGPNGAVFLTPPGPLAMPAPGTGGMEDVD